MNISKFLFLMSDFKREVENNFYEIVKNANVVDFGNGKESLQTILRPSSVADLNENNLSEDLVTAFCSLTKPASPMKPESNNINIGNSKAYYYSQLSIMLFERAVEENPTFPEDLDRVHSWFMRELSDAQKLVCLHELLSLISPSQHRFLFTSVAFDTQQSSGEEEAVWLDLAMSEAQKQSTRVPMTETNKLEDRLKSLDMKPGESLFSGLRVAKSKLPTEKTNNNNTGGCNNSDGDNSNSCSGSGSGNAVGTITAGGLVTTNTSTSCNTSSNSGATYSHSHVSLQPTPSNSQCSNILTDLQISRTNSFTDSLILNSSKSSQSSQTLTPVSMTENSKFSSFMKTTSKSPKDPLAGKAPPGFLSPTAIEFRPSEPSCYAEVYLSNDFTHWLRLLRLHKYSECLNPFYSKDKIEFLKIDEKSLEAAGVVAMGARKKFLRLFERIRHENKL